jgi:hypothetical protein
MDLRPITRLRRLGVAGSEQSMARTLTGRHDEANQRVTPACDASGPAVLRDHTTCPEEQSYAEAPLF